MVAVEISSRSGVTWRLITFTYQANVLAAAYYLWTLASPRADARVGLRGAAVLYVVIAGIVWNLFLTNHSMGYTAANFLLHVVVPVLAFTDWLLIGRGQGRVQWWQPFVWLAYPAAYVVLALVILNKVGRRAPYYFLDPGSVGRGYRDREHLCAGRVRGRLGLRVAGGKPACDSRSNRCRLKRSERRIRSSSIAVCRQRERHAEAVRLAVARTTLLTN